MNLSRRSLVLCLLFCFFAAIPALSAIQNENPASLSLYRKAYADYKDGDAEAALSKLKEALRLSPGYPHPHLLAGRIYQERFESTMHFYPEAMAEFEAVLQYLQANPSKDNYKDLYLAHFYKGLLEIKGGDYGGALVELDRFLEVYPDFEGIAKVQNARGIAYYYLDQYDQAVSSFKRALTAEPSFAEARFNLRSVHTRAVAFNEAMVLYRSREPAKALKTLEALKTIAPRYLAARRLEAKILVELKRPEEAVAVFEEILGFQPNDPETYWMRIDMARALMSLNKKPQARGALLENLSRFPLMEDLRAKMEVVTLLTQLGDAQ